MELVLHRKVLGKVFIPVGCSETVFYASEKIRSVVAAITGSFLEIESVETVGEDKCGIALVTADGLSKFSEGKVAVPLLLSDDGFAVIRHSRTVFIVSNTDRGVFFGACDMLEKNADVIFNRGAAGESVSFYESDSFDIRVFDYTEESPFSVRGWNLCGTGSEKKQHADDGTAEYLGSNKSNGVFHYMDEKWRKFGLFGAGLRIEKLNCFDDLIVTHPEYFMVGTDGKPMPALGGCDSFLNYYNAEIAIVFAQRLVSVSENFSKQDAIFWVMPDSPYFYMADESGSLCDKPFTADDGTVVCPSDDNYKSTVYFNFLNIVIKEANRIKPGTRLSVFAYLYSETVPAIDVDPNITVYVAPITTNDKYSYVDKKCSDNANIKINLERWTKRTNNLGVYLYWCSLRGIYSRPIQDVVRENLVWFKSLGIKKIIVESKVDCTVNAFNTAAQNYGVKFYDLNEPFIWLINKLMWNPYADTAELLQKFCKTVYKECSDLMFEYFSLIKSGWDKKQAMVWYTTGGDIYYLQFVIGAGIAERVKKVLIQAENIAVTGSVKRKVQSIRETVEEQIAKYKDFVKEDAEVYYCEGGRERILSEDNMNYVFNPDSVWNSAKPLRVIRDYDTLKYYPEEANFSCRMLCDNKNIYIGYTVFDDGIKSLSVSADKNLRVYREDGSELESYAETYIGGNVFNQTTYYGYISGFTINGNKEGSFYENSGVPERIPLPEGVSDVKYVHFDEDKNKRYYFHVQVIPFTALGTDKNTASPYGSFVYYTNRYGRAGWMGYGLWSKQNFSPFTLLFESDKKRKGVCFNGQIAQEKGN